MFHDLYGTPVVITRVYMAYGPRQTATKIIPYTIRSLLAGETPQLGSGERLVDWIYVEDAIDGSVTLASAPGIEGRTIDLGSGVLLPIRDVVKRIATLLDSPLEPAFGALPAAPRENVRVADVAATLATIGWRNTTLLDDGLRQTIDWYRGLAATSTADATPAPCYSAISTSERNQVRQPQKLTFFSATEVQQP
jgi:nucleoside-diphosphate-sugar epimerase